MTRGLLRQFDEFPKIRILRVTLHEQMDVIGHHAVRNDCKLTSGRCFQNVLDDQSYRSWILEQPAAVVT
jgi:hypothetical protein